MPYSCFLIEDQFAQHIHCKEIRLRKIVPIAFLILTAALASAQLPKGNLFVGYSYSSFDNNNGGRSNLNGWNGSLEGSVLPFIGIVVDVSGHYGTQPATTIACTAVIGGTCPTSLDSRVYNYLVGPRVSVSVHGIRPFAHVLFGGAHTNESTRGLTLTDTSFANAIGGGVDVRLAPFLGWRVQGDLLQTRFFSHTQQNARISTGLVLRF